MTARTLSRASLALLVTLAAGAIACSSSSTAGTNAAASSDPSASAAAASASAATVANAPAVGNAAPVKVRILTTEGTIVVELDPAHAPLSVANFLHYVDQKFYDGGTFFRAIPGFVIQGGNKPRESPGDSTVALEDPQKTGLRNVNGAIAMARTSDPNSATSEFFLDDGPQSSLDGSPDSPGYAVFGHVVSGMDVVRKIARLPANAEYLVKPIKIVKIERL